MAAPAPIKISYPMTDAEMHAVLKTACGVENCDLKAQAIFDAAVSFNASVWAFVRTELNLDASSSLRFWGGDLPTYWKAGEPPLRAHRPTYPTCFMLLAAM